MKFKINTATHQAGTEKMEASREMMKEACITYEQWASLVFEIGCQFVERHVKLKYLADAFLQNPQLGFWNWWLIIFMEDDASLLTFNTEFTPERYKREKVSLVYMDEMQEQFSHFLKRNKVINGKEV